MPTNTEFPKATYHFDPYRNFRFRVKWDNKYVAGVSKVSALTRTAQVITHRGGGDPGTPRRMPGQSEYQAITLERGVTHDVEFEQWANKVWDYHTSTVDDRQAGAGNQEVSLKDFRKDIVLEVYNEAGQKVLAYNIYRCWPSEFTALPEMDANGNAVAIQTLKLENEGWERVPRWRSRQSRASRCPTVRKTLDAPSWPWACRDPRNFMPPASRTRNAKFWNAVRAVTEV